MDAPHVYIFVSDITLRARLARAFARSHFIVHTESVLPGEATRVRTNGAALVVADDASANPGNGFIQTLRNRDDGSIIPCILVATASSEALAIAALKAGVADYFTLPLGADALVAAAERCVRAGVKGSGRAAPSGGRLDRVVPEMVGESRSIQEVRTAIERLASFDSNVLITGETGTGKELAAQLIHLSGDRRAKPFVPINCAALPDSLVESELFGYERGAFTGAVASYEGTLKQADGGSAFFDEIGDMGLSAQAKVLRAIEARELQRLGSRGRVGVDIRIIAATNQDLDSLVTQGRFRRDLYYRVDVARVHLPPLRDRKEDLPLLCRRYIEELNRKFGRSVEQIGPDALECLLNYDWPGNIRELKNVLEAIFLNLPPTRVTHLSIPDALRNRLHAVAHGGSRERDQMLSALSATNWNKSKAAEKLSWSRMTLYRKMAKYGVSGGSD